VAIKQFIYSTQLIFTIPLANNQAKLNVSQLGKKRGSS